MYLTVVRNSLFARGIRGDLWVGFYFLQSLLINFALGYEYSMFYVLAFSCVLLLLGSCAPRIQKILIALCSLAAAVYFPFGRVYGPPDFNMLLALHATNVEESTEIITSFPWYHYLVSIIILTLGFIAVSRKMPVKSPWNHFNSFCVAIGLVGFFITPVQLMISARANLSYHPSYQAYRLIQYSGYPIFRFVRDLIANNQDVFDEQIRMQEFAKMKDTWNVVAVKPNYHTYVVVIGESARRDALGAFGGHWSNTPFASSVNGNLFADYISAASATVPSLGMTLNRMVDGKPQYQNNFVTLANRAGFQTWWLSNQGQIGEFDTPISSIAKHADVAQFLKSGDYTADKNTRDAALLKMTARVFATPRITPQLIVLHLMGSHPNACARTHGKYKNFVQSKETSCYLYSITQTDNLLKQLYQQLQNTGNSFSMVYFSDHGLAFQERGTNTQYLAHDDKFQQNFQVPFMVLSSDDRTHHLIKARRSARDFLNFFSEWTGIQTKELTPKYKFVSEQNSGPVFITDFNLKQVDYTHLQTDIFETKIQ